MPGSALRASDHELVAELDYLALHPALLDHQRLRGQCRQAGRGPCAQLGRRQGAAGAVRHRQQRLAQANRVASAQRSRAVDPLVVDERPVGRAEVLDGQLPVGLAHRARVPPRQLWVVAQPSFGKLRRPADQQLRIDRQQGAGVLALAHSQLLARHAGEPYASPARAARHRLIAMPACPNCGEETPERARFCPVCGVALTEVPAPQGLRKVVTIVFCDLCDSTKLGERLDPETLRQVIARYFEAMSEALNRHQGAIEKFIGDAVMAVFGTPTVREDDALRAVRAAAEMRSTLADLNDQLEQRWGVRLQARTGVNTGEVITGDPSRGEGFVSGDAVNVAARLEQSAPPDEILIGERTLELVRHAVVVEPVPPLELKGKSEPVPAFRLVEVHDKPPERERRMNAPLVGREPELAVLREAFDRAVAGRTCELVTLVGPAGIGKSRLAEEFEASVGDEAKVVAGRCLSYGEGLTFWPLRAIVEGLVGSADDESSDQAQARIARLLDDDEDTATVVERV